MLNVMVMMVMTMTTVMTRSSGPQGTLGTWWVATRMEKLLSELPTRLGPWQCSMSLPQQISTTLVSFNLKHFDVRLYAMVVKFIRQHFFVLRLVGLSVSAIYLEMSSSASFLFCSLRTLPWPSGCIICEAPKVPG